MRLTAWIKRAQQSPRLRNNRFIRSAGGWVIRSLLRFGKYQWETKSYEFWTFLMVTLLVVRPRSMVELGTGRSSNYLAEYAGKYGAQLACIEQNRWFAKRMCRALRDGLLDDSVIHFVPLADDGWYVGETLDRVTPQHLEMLFVDGPVGFEEGLGPGSRDLSRTNRWIGQAASGARLLVVDDVDRPQQLALFRELVESTGLTGCFLLYPAALKDGIVAVAMNERDWSRVRLASDAAGITIYDDFAKVEQVAVPRRTAAPA